MTLATKADPAVETGPRSVGVSTHVPLAEVSRLITGGLQVLRKESRTWFRQHVVVDDAVFVHVLARQDRCATRRAKRRRHHRIFEVDPFTSHRVHGRSLYPGMP